MGERGWRRRGEEQGMKMLPKKSKNCLEPRGRDLIWGFFFFFFFIGGGEAGL